MVKKGDIVRLVYPVGGTYFRHGRHGTPEVCVPKDRYVVLKKTKTKMRLAVQLNKGCRSQPSSKHIYEISKRNFNMIAADKRCKR